MAGSFEGIDLPDVQVIRQLARDQLVSHLENAPGKKDLVLDADLMKPLDRIAGASLLKEHGVDRIFRLEPGKPLPVCEQRVYLIRPQIKTIKYIADQITAEVNARQSQPDLPTTITRYCILMVPRKLHVCEKLLEQEGVFGHVTIHEYQLDFIPLDDDVISLEMPYFFRSFYLENDQTWIHTAARSLLTLQQIFGLISNVHCLGRCAKMVDELTNVMFEAEGEPKQLNNSIGHMFIIDRDLDYVTPLCSQVTYEGLLHDTFGISSGFIEFGKNVTGVDRSMKLLLSSADMLYEDIRDRHFSNVFVYLSGKAKELQSGYDKRHNLKSVQDMKSFVAKDLKNLKQQHKSLTIHIGACEVIMNQKTKGDFEDQLHAEHALLEGVDTKENVAYIEELINRQYTASLCLRLLCLLSLTQGGLNTTMYRSLKTQFMHSHGFDHMLTFHNLKKLGMYKEIEGSASSKPLGKVAAAAMANIPKTSVFRSVCKKLQLIPKSADEVNLKNPNDMSYVYSGAYTPLLCKLIDQFLTGSSAVAEDVLRTIGAKYHANIRAKSQKGKTAGGGTLVQQSSSRVVLVYFLGGVTFSEITALRFLGRLKGYKFLIATTGIINANGLMDTISEVP